MTHPSSPLNVGWKFKKSGLQAVCKDCGKPIHPAAMKSHLNTCKVQRERPEGYGES